DIVEQPIEVRGGSVTPIKATLVRSVDTRGWVSTDFHNHASPSGDNVSSQYGRVLNLLCENVEFAPCTEHNRLSSYAPHLKRMGAEHLLASCVGIELTSSPLPLGHNNSFPLHMHEHTQDNGAPLPDGDPEVQVARLALWDDRSEKLVQQNHPDLGWLLFDKDGDGKPDGGYNVLPHLDVIEVHPPHHIFDGALLKSKDSTRNNTIFNWMQLLNQGVRRAGVVNTDAHYNIHGSGWLRNWIVCPTDNPAEIQVLDIVHAAEHGHIIISNGPFLEASAQTVGANDRRRAISGDDLRAPSGKVQLDVRVQCPNWFDVDRVQVFVNGRANEKLNFTRDKQPAMFSNDTVRFDQTISLELPTDAHLIVATIGENSKLGHVFGPEHEEDKPVAVSNPIYIDVDGNGFTANKDTLGAPLPVKASASK
ncbi:MAG TPA: CehA/McbA family metallohydrolase, partial [Pirellulales bacterium]|nr:CehA/McbA family metallohydrolase [Pirellulales bacterium]